MILPSYAAIETLGTRRSALLIHLIIPTTHRNLDQGLFIRMIRVLPWNGSLGLLEVHDFGGRSFEWSALRDLDEFDQSNGNPSWEFLDPTLETSRATLVAHISKFLKALSTNTFPAHKHGFNIVPPEWESNEPERFTRAIREINDTAKSLCRRI